MLIFMLLQYVDFLTACSIFFRFSRPSCRSSDSMFAGDGKSKPDDDSTQLIMTLRMTQMVEVVPLIYGMLLHSGVFAKEQDRGQSPVQATQFARHTLDVAEVCLSLLNHVALIDLHMLQVYIRSAKMYCDRIYSIRSLRDEKRRREPIVHRRVCLWLFFVIVDTGGRRCRASLSHLRRDTS